MVDSRRSYGEVINQSSNEQLLRNIVRLYYRETPSVLALTQVLTQFKIRASASVGVQIADNGNEYPLGVEARYEEVPTVTYTPAVGREFALRMLSPIRFENVLLLSLFGWDLRRLMISVVREINGLRGYPISVGHHATVPATIKQFSRVVVLMEELETQQVLRTILLGEQQVHFLFEPVPKGSRLALHQAELKQLLALDPKRDLFPVV